MRRRLTAVLLIALVTGGALAGCAPKPEVSDEAAQGLQASVQLVAEHAAAADPAAAVTELEALQARLDAAVQSGDVSDERSQTIQAAIDLVGADLEQQIAAAEAAAAAKQAAADKLAEEQAAADKLAEEQAAAEQAEKDKGKPGRGNDKDDDD